MRASCSRRVLSSTLYRGNTEVAGERWCLGRELVYKTSSFMGKIVAAHTFRGALTPGRESFASISTVSRGDRNLARGPARAPAIAPPLATVCD
jgi:hypothetical protein